MSNCDICRPNLPRLNSPRTFLESLDNKLNKYQSKQDATQVEPQKRTESIIHDSEFYAKLCKINLSFPLEDISRDREMSLGAIWEGSINETDIFDEDYSAIHVLLTERQQHASIYDSLQFVKRVEAGGKNVTLTAFFVCATAVVSAEQFELRRWMTELSHVSGLFVIGTDAEREMIATRIYDLFMRSGLAQPHSEMDFLRLLALFNNATPVDVRDFVQRMMDSGRSVLNKVPKTT